MLFRGQNCLRALHFMLCLFSQTLCVFAINEPGFFCLLGDCINHYSLEVLGAVVSNRHKVQIAIF